MSRIRKTLQILPGLVLIWLFAMAFGVSCNRESQVASVDFDVIVVGSGLTGHASTEAALEAGATVGWFEKNERLGGSAPYATGTFSAAETDLQRQFGIEDSVDLHREDINRIGQNRADQALLQLLVEDSPRVWERLLSFSLEPNERGPVIDPVHSPYSVPRTMTPAVNSASEYNAVLHRQIERHQDRLTVYTGTTVIELLNGADGVRGVAAVANGVRTEYTAHAVILATGGYGSNFDLIAEYAPEYANILSVTPQFATGDGHIMAREIGARLVHMDMMVPYFAGMPPAEGQNIGFGDLTSRFPAMWQGDVWLASDGRRFTNEDQPDAAIRERALQSIPEARVIMLFDQAMVEHNNGIPVRDFDRRLAESDHIVAMDSIDEIAVHFNLPVETVRETVSNVNDVASGNGSCSFGREVVLPLSYPPFYAMEVFGVTFMTQGGIAVNTNLEVIHENGSVIPGLYAAGEALGTAQFTGDGYASGTGNTGPLVFGMHAGTNAAAFAATR